MDELSVREYLAQGEILTANGNFDAAIEYFDKAERENPMEIEIYLARGVAYANQDKFAEAKDQFEKALKINRKSGIAYFQLGNIAIMQEDTATGFEYYNQALSNGYDNAQLYYSMGLLSEEHGDIDTAVRNYTLAIKKDPLRPDIRVRKIQLLIFSEQMPEAMKEIDEMILINPDIFEGYHLKFSVLLQLNQLDEAEVFLEEAIELFPEDPDLMIDKSSLLIDQGKPDEALELLRKLEDEPWIDDACRRKICIERAQIYATREDAETATSELEKANAISQAADLFDSEVVFLLINCHLATEQFDKMLEYAIELKDKSEDDYYKNSARYFEPFALKNLGRMDEATPIYLDAISEFRSQALDSPGNMDAYILRIMCLRDIEQYDKALELIDYVLELQPESPEPRMVRVTILEALGREEDALAEAELIGDVLPKILAAD